MTKKERVTRVVFAAYVILVALFVVSSIYQIGARVFSRKDAAGADIASPAVGSECAQAITAEMQAIEAARVAASHEGDAESARRRYQAARPDREPVASVQARCQADAVGTEALAALARLDRSAEALSVRDASELRSVRLEAQSFIRGANR